MPNLPARGAVRAGTVRLLTITVWKVRRGSNTCVVVHDRSVRLAAWSTGGISRPAGEPGRSRRTGRTARHPLRPCSLLCRDPERRSSRRRILPVRRAAPPALVNSCQSLGRCPSAPGADSETLALGPPLAPKYKATHKGEKSSLPGSRSAKSDSFLGLDQFFEGGKGATTCWKPEASWRRPLQGCTPGGLSAKAFSHSALGTLWQNFLNQGLAFFCPRPL